MLNRWSASNAPALFGANYSKYKLNSWEYTTPGSLASVTNSGPSAADQLKLPTAIQQARYDIYMVYGDGTFGHTIRRFTPLLISDAETKVLNQFQTALFNSSKTYGGTRCEDFVHNLNPAATSCIWNFGDGGTTNTATSVGVSHTYTNAGAYTVTLTATDSNGTQTMQRNNYINIYALPTTASYTTNVVKTWTHPATVLFTNTSVNANYGSWSIYNPTGPLASTNRIAGMASPPSIGQFFTFTNAGTYPVVFSASNPGGSVSTTNTITVQ